MGRYLFARIFEYTVSEYPTVDFGNIDGGLAMGTLDDRFYGCHTGLFYIGLDNVSVIGPHSLNRPIKNNL